MCKQTLHHKLMGMNKIKDYLTEKCLLSGVLNCSEDHTHVKSASHESSRVHVGGTSVRLAGRGGTTDGVQYRAPPVHVVARLCRRIQVYLGGTVDHDHTSRHLLVAGRGRAG